MENGRNCHERDTCLKVGTKNLLIFHKSFLKELVKALTYGACESKFPRKLGIVVLLLTS